MNKDKPNFIFIVLQIISSHSNGDLREVKYEVIDLNIWSKKDYIEFVGESVDSRYSYSDKYHGCKVKEVKDKKIINELLQKCLKEKKEKAKGLNSEISFLKGMYETLE